MKEDKVNELRCKKCDTILTQGAKECPSCGYQIEKEKNEYIPLKSIIPLLLGIAIIIMGITLMNTEVSIDTYSAEYYDARHASFGADFYSYIYGASDIIVDELNDINGGIEVLSESMVVMANIIYYPIGMMIVALGLSVVAVSLNHIKKETV